MKARLYLIVIISAAVLVLFTSESNFFLAPLETIINGKEISLSGQMIALSIAFITLCLILILGIVDKMVLFFRSEEKKEIERKEKV
jgi:hypothetical protein